MQESLQIGKLDALAWRLFEESNDAIMLIDPVSEIILHANPIAQRITRRPLRELRHLRLEQLLSDSGQIGTLRSAIRETAYFHSQEEFFLEINGREPLAVNISASRIHLPTGDLGLLVVRDISDRKRAETALRDFNDELQRRVELRTAKLQAANCELAQEVERRKAAQQSLDVAHRQLLETIGQLERAQADALHRERVHALEQIAGGVAHDINNSLAPIATFAELLLNTPLPDPAHSWIATMQTAAQDIAAIVQRLRQFYDPSSQGERECIDVAELIDDVRQLTSTKVKDASMRGRSVDITVHGSKGLQVLGDPSALRSVFINLVFNAIDAVEQNGCITIATRHEPPDLVVVEVSDDGVGMDEALQRQCQDPFFTTKPQGTGLGLSVCQGIAESHGGRVEIESTFGQGTTVRVLIPSRCPKEACERSENETGNEFARLRGIRVLYIDDNESVIRSVSALFQSMEIDLVTAADGKQGLDILAEQSFDVVMTDLNMPGWDGRKVAAKIKQIRPELPVVLVTGWADWADAGDANSVKPDIVLTKPFSIGRLTAELASLVSPS